MIAKADTACILTIELLIIILTIDLLIIEL